MSPIEEMHPSDFSRFQKLIYEKIGLHLTDKKKALLTNRIRKRLVALSLDSYRKYYDFVKAEGNQAELVRMIDAVTTNVTDFFRHRKQFDAFNTMVLPEIIERKKREKTLRVLSAGCSTGEEPYTIAIILLEKSGQMPGWDVQIDAFDISTAVLAKAKEGIYPGEKMRLADSGDGLPAKLVQKYFLPFDEGCFHIRDEVRRLVRFDKFNLTRDHIPKTYDVIFCRNVVIYFDKETKCALYQKFHKALDRGGYLLVGYSEGLLGDASFKYVHPGIYLKSGM